MHSIRAEIRQSLAYSCTQMDQALGLAAGTWEKVEKGEQKISLLQLVRLLRLLLRATFGTKSFSAAQLALVNAELLYTKQQLDEMTVQQDGGISSLAQQASKAIAAAYAILNR